MREQLLWSCPVTWLAPIMVHATQMSPGTLCVARPIETHQNDRSKSRTSCGLIPMLGSEWARAPTTDYCPHTIHS
ncbi:hypothetical protein F4808DRAFT_425178 [Astrocystis sublimbata]|nr:hypothetical protein F4808DRAFT_425178 [Astrocystis sublimbata]